MSARRAVAPPPPA